ncbi:hypothetical protein [Streptomyces sp. Tue6028]|uniref:hypothetical protein n=1 Tax=Streptomyces sp. Tue6028 TaxID=2036037 RepID=UPI003D72C7E1
MTDPKKPAQQPAAEKKAQGAKPKQTAPQRSTAVEKHPVAEGLVEALRRQDVLLAAQAADQEVAAESDVTDELAKGGPALGSFVEAVGLAVAKAQSELDKSLVKTAQALSEQKIRVISIYEQVLNDDGVMTQGNALESELPLINFLMPTAYAWKRVYLEADMSVSEFNGKNGLNIQSSSLYAYAAANANFGLFNVTGSVSGGFGYSNTNLNVGSTVSRDTAAGSLHLEATLEPRADVQLPRPFVIQKGPRLVLSSGTVTDIAGKDPDNRPVVIGRQTTLTVECRRPDGSANSGRTLSIRVDPAGLAYELSSTTTGADGRITVTLKRTGALYDNGAPPVDATIRVSLGLVSESMSLRF